MLTSLPECELLGLGHRESWVLFLYHIGSRVRFIGSFHISIGVSVIHSDITLDVTSSLILVIVVNEDGSPRLVQESLGTEVGFNVVVGTGWYFFPEFTEP